MRTFCKSFLLSGLILLSACGEDIRMDTHLTTYEQVSGHFKNVPASYRTVPFWVWNGKMTRDVIDRQLSDYAEKGYGGVFVHPRYGLINDYASEEWYELVDYANTRAKRLGLDLWLYDENSFPSGFAGGHVPAEMPESYNEGHALRLHVQDTFRLDPEVEYELIYLQDDSLVDITATYKDYVGERGEYLLYEKVYYPVRDWYAGYSYVDLIKPGVTEKFIEVTMDGYEQTLGKEFGASVPGIFTDEPNIAPQGEGHLIRWTPDLFDRFRDRWGYSLEPHLVSLQEDLPGAGRIRHNYYQLLLELFIERWSRPWYEYGENHDLAWTGHYWEHGWPSPHHGPDNMAMYAYHQVPGIDMLFNSWEGRPDQFGNIRAVRELNSVANQLGRVRKLSETYGAAGWELTFEDMKRNGDWEFVLGVNLMNQHLSYQTLLGDRKHDFPQSFSYHAPYWEDLQVLNDYYARLSLALSSGEQVNKVLILEPTTSAWMHYSVNGEADEISMINDEFNKLLTLLENEQIEYDLGSENIIKNHGLASDGRFVIGERNYNYVVIPRFLTNLNSETVALLEEYLDQGGTVIALCQVPSYIDGQKTEKIADLSLEYSDQWFSLGGCNDPRLINYLRRDDFVVVEQTGGALFHMRRQLEKGQLLFLVNSDKNESSNLRMMSQGVDIAHMDLFTGEIENYPCVLADKILSFDAEIEPCGSLLLYISDEDIRGKKGRISKWYGTEQELRISNIDVQLQEDNAFTLDYCKVIMDGDTSGLEYFYDAQNKIFRHHGFPKNPWVSASQFKTEIIDQDTFPKGTGFTVQYPFFVDTEFSTKIFNLVVERPDLYEVRLNETLLEPTKDQWWLDRNFGLYRITDGLVRGENFIEISIDPMSVYAELEPVYLVGDFDVLPLDQGWILAASEQKELGSWKEQGMPFYSDKVTYSAEFELEDEKPVRIQLGNWSGTVSSVTVNGEDAGEIFMKPYDLRIDNFVKRGKNQVEVTVCGSLKNLLGPHHNVRNQGIVTPWSFKYAPGQQPAGTEYDLVDYGLFETFRVFTLEK